MKTVKQIIVMRKDLRNTKGEKIRTGKLIAQGAHASMAVILNMMKKKKFDYTQHNISSIDKPIPYSQRFIGEERTLIIDTDTPLDEWLNGRFTKVCLSCDSEEELIKLYEQAKEANLPCVLITDAGLTEFNGVPTKTCIAIGPAYSEDIDKITSHLKLL